MFEFVRSHTRLLQFILVLLIFPAFVFFGVQGYTGMGEGNTVVAKVAGTSITQAEWDAAHRNQVERMRAQSPGVDLKLFDTPEAKQRTLDALVRERVMLVAADKLHLTASDERLQRVFASDPQLAFLRKPDGSLNADVLAAQGMSARQFEQQLRQDLAMRQVLQGVSGTVLAPSRPTSTALDALLQQREVRIARFEAQKFVTKVNVTDADIEAYYKDGRHAAEFETPEQASIEYLVLDLDAIKSGLTVSDDDLRKYYAENESRYVEPEERRASHILIKVDASATADQKKAARAKAEGLLAQIKQNPAQFAELARKNSDDPGSAANGGDLEFFGRGAMVKAFDDTAFKLKKGEVSGLVETEYGLHIIQLNDVRGGTAQPFEAVRAQIEDEARKQLAQRQFAEAAERFTNSVYEQSDSLKPVADELKLPLLTMNGVLHVPGDKDQGPLSNRRVLDALFDASNRAKGRNTEAVEVSTNKLVSARIVKHSPAALRAFDEVKDELRTRWVADAAAKAARADADKKLTAWKAAPDKADLPAAVKMSRKTMFSQPPLVLDAALRVPEKQLPAFTLVDLGADGVAVLKVNKVLPLEISPQELKETQNQFGSYWGRAEADAYYQALKHKHKVEYLNEGKKVMSAQKSASAS